MKLYIVRISPCCRIIWLYCLRNNIQVELIDVDLFEGEHKSPEFLKLNPHAEVPVLVDGETSIFEASAILRYLACKYTNHADFGTSVTERMKTLSLVNWVSFELHRVVGYRIVYPQFFEKYRLPEEANEALIEKGTQELITFLENIESHSLAATPYLGSNHVTVGDIYAATVLIQLEWIDFDISLWPNLQSWLAKIKDIQHWNTVHEKHNGFLRQLHQSNVH